MMARDTVGKGRDYNMEHREKPTRPPPPVPPKIVVTTTPASDHLLNKPVKGTSTVHAQHNVKNNDTGNRKTKAGAIPGLWPIKVMIFLVSGGMASLYPFFTLHMKSLGITIKETAIISFLLPLLSCVGVLLVGALSNKIGHYKWIILGLTAGHVFCHLFLLSIPAFQLVETFANQRIESVEIAFHCQNRENAVFSITQETGVKCDASATGEIANELQFDSCRTDCPLGSFSVHEQPSVCFLNTTGGRGHYCPKWTDLENQVLKNISFSFLPAERGRNSAWETKEFRNDEGALLRSAHCFIGPQPETDLAGSERIVLAEAERLPKCAIYCQASASFVMLCRTDVFREGNSWFTLVAYFFLRLFGLIGLLSVFVILDTVTQQLTQNQGGVQDIHWIASSLAFIVFPILSGFLMGRGWGFTTTSDFFPAFLLFGGLNLIAALVALCMKIPADVRQTDVPWTGVWGSAGRVLRNPQVIAVIVMMMVICMAFGYFGSFLFWFLETELSMSKFFMGAGTALGSLLAVPLILSAHRWIKSIGHGSLLVIVTLLMGLRFVAYSYLFDVNLYFVVEILTAGALAIAYAMPLYYRQLIAPAYPSTVQAIIMVAIFGLGAGVGPFIGGYLISSYGHRISLQIFAVAYLIIALIYLLVHCLFLRKIKPPAVEPEHVVFARQQEPSTTRNSELFPDETETMLYREKMSPMAESDGGFRDPIWLYGSRPVSGVRPFS